MPKCSEVALELRKLADALDSTPDAAIVSPNIYFSCSWCDKPKETFLNVVKALPRPLTKKYTPDEFRISYKSDAMDVVVYTKRELICTIVEPAKPAVYRCDPLLSEDEDSAIATEVQP